MSRRSILALTAIAIALGTAVSFLHLPTTANAQASAAADSRGRCVGIAAVESTDKPPAHRVYRAFEDGTVEVLDNPTAGKGQWVKVGK
jgi:hypothetical protein